MPIVREDPTGAKSTTFKTLDEVRSWARLSGGYVIEPAQPSPDRVQVLVYPAAAFAGPLCRQTFRDVPQKTPGQQLAERCVTRDGDYIRLRIARGATQVVHCVDHGIEVALRGMIARIYDGDYHFEDAGE